MTEQQTTTEETTKTEEAGQTETSQAETKAKEEAVPVLRRNFAHLAPDGDINKVISLANELRDLEKDGFRDVIDSLRAQGITGHELSVFLRTTLAGEAGADKPAGKAEDKPAGDDKGKTATDDNADDKPMTRREMLAELNRLRAEADEAAEQRLRRHDAEQMTRQQIAQAKREEEQAVSESIAAYNLPDMKRKTRWVGGEETEIDVPRDIVEAATRALTHRIHLNRLNPRDPEFQAKADMPWSPQDVRLAQELLLPFVKQFFGQAGAKGDGHDTDNKNKVIPPATTRGGAGGRPGKDPSTMTVKERDELVLAKIRAARKAAGTT